ncbi:unnamed protein product [Paramecium primaurelia]|uniref:Uncharacterized protein n=1 Tax=Paramecium primaurelia TaxID=5886 RepID=A0A8S1K9L5_PARPR|nr:unnamed protein product [Paramecium primaurelia]
MNKSQYFCEKITKIGSGNLTIIFKCNTILEQSINAIKRQMHHLNNTQKSNQSQKMTTFLKSYFLKVINYSVLQLLDRIELVFIKCRIL